MSEELTQEEMELIERQAFLIRDKYMGCQAIDAIRRLGTKAGQLKGVQMVLAEIRSWRK